MAAIAHTRRAAGARALPGAAALMLGAACWLAAAPWPARAAERSTALYRLDSALPPPPGTLVVGLGGELFRVQPPGAGAPFPVRALDARLRLEYSLHPGLRLRASVPYRRWHGTAGEGYPGRAAGLGDAGLDLLARLPGSGRRLAWAARAALAQPLGRRDDGLSESAAAAELGLAATVRLWPDSHLPELRLHLQAARRWNPDQGRFAGAVPGRFTPWPPLYPAVPEGGSGGDNDLLLLGAAVEIRKGITSLFVEYTEPRLPAASGVAGCEFARCLTSGVHWGGLRGWGLSTAYDVSLARDDPGTPFAPAYPDLAYHMMISYARPRSGR